jgi:hypothetical protein
MFVSVILGSFMRVLASLEVHGILFGGLLVAALAPSVQSVIVAIDFRHSSGFASV